MNINWKARLKNKYFWLTAIPTALALVQAVLTCFGIVWDYTEISKELLAVVYAAFAFLAALGVVMDPTTKGFSDSARAMSYDAPNDDSGEQELKEDANA